MVESIFAIKPIKPNLKSVDARRYAKEYRKAVRTEITTTHKLLRKPIRAWSNKPRFRRRVTSNKFQISEKISTTQAAFSALNTGTDKRWAIMSNPFTPKTSPNSMSSRTGRGFPVARGRTAVSKIRGPKGAMPGIKARNWTKMIKKERKKPFKDSVKAATKRAATP